MNKVVIALGIVGYVAGVIILWLRFGWMAGVIGYITCVSAGIMAIGLAEHDRKYDEDEEEM